MVSEKLLKVLSNVYTEARIYVEYREKPRLKTYAADQYKNLKKAVEEANKFYMRIR